HGNHIVAQAALTTNATPTDGTPDRLRALSKASTMSESWLAFRPNAGEPLVKATIVPTPQRAPRRLFRCDKPGRHAPLPIKCRGDPDRAQSRGQISRRGYLACPRIEAHTRDALKAPVRWPNNACDDNDKTGNTHGAPEIRSLSRPASPDRRASD